jgi:hypothetical protein
MVFILKETMMSKDIQQCVDTSSAEFKEGVEAGLNSTEDIKNWKAGNDLGLTAKAATEEPLFMSDSPEGHQGNAQDEKDETEE